MTQRDHPLAPAGGRTPPAGAPAQPQGPQGPPTARVFSQPKHRIPIQTGTAGPATSRSSAPRRAGAQHARRAVPAGRTSRRAAPALWYRRRPAVLIAAGLALLLLVGISAVVVTTQRKPVAQSVVGLNQSPAASEQPTIPGTPSSPPSTQPGSDGSTSATGSSSSTGLPVETATPSYPANNAAAVRQVLPAVGQGVVFGFWVSGGGDVRTVEQKMGVTFGAVRRYKDFNASQLWPNDEDKQLAAGGRLVHAAWETMSFDGGYDPSLQPAPAVTAADAHSGMANRKIWTYRQILNGSLDRYIDTVALRIKNSGATYMIDFNHEADDAKSLGGSNTQRDAAGTPREYAASYRYLVNRFRALRVTNVVWAITWSGWMAKYPDKHWVFRQLWPGAGYVNAILWDPYNTSASQWRSFADLVRPMYNALRNGLLDAVDPTAKNLPYGLGEFGSIPDARRPQWLRDIPGQLHQFPRLTYVNYYSSGDWGSMHNDPAAVAALGQALRSPYILTRNPATR